MTRGATSPVPDAGTLARRSRRRWRLALLALLAAPAAGQIAGEAVTLQLKWYHQFQFAGYYAALDQGYYAAEGLEVTVLEGDAEHPPIPAVLSGRAQYGVGDAEVLLARLQGAPVVVCAAIFQHSPYVLLSRRDRGIFTPSDLVGARVMVSNDQGAAQVFALLHREGIDIADVRFLPHSWKLADLIEGRVDAISAYASVEPFQLRARGYEPALLRTSDYGIDFYGDTLFTTEAEIAAHPERVAAFKRASMKGWSYALQNVDEVVESILRRPGVVERGLTRELLRQEAEVMRELILPDLVELGHMNAMRWRRIAEEFAQQGLAPPGATFAGFLWDPDPPADLRGLWWTTGLAAAALLGFGVVSLWNVQMGRRVRSRTAELQDEILQRQQAELELRASRERLLEQASLLDMARDAILVCDLDRVVRYWNTGAERIYGWSASEALGRAAKDLLADPGVGDLAWAETLADGEWRGELRHRTRDGRELLVESRWSLVRDGRGRPRSVLEINTDVTESRRIAQQLLRAQRMESIGTLAGGMAHDINNLLAPVLMGVDLIRPEVASVSGQEVLETIAQSARRGAELVRRVLTFSRGLEGIRIPLRVDDLVGELRAIVESTFPKQIEVALDLASGADGVLGDPTQIGQVLLNLAVNARDAMPRGGRLTIVSRSVTLDAPRPDAAGELATGRYLTVELRDTGTGIPPEIVDRLFDPFFTTKEPGQGTGLGLPTALGILRAHGGGIEVETSPGLGSTFRIYLPAVSEPAAAILAAGGAETPAPGGNGELLIVVDDEPPILALARRTLENAGYRTATARNGVEALAAYDRLRSACALVLTDLTMPGMSGAELVAALRGRDPELPILVASGLAERPERLVAAGAAEFLAKPFSTDALLRSVHRALGRRRAPSSDPG